MLRMLRIVRIAPRSAWGLAATRSDPAHPPDPEHPHPSQRPQGQARQTRTANGIGKEDI